MSVDFWAVKLKEDIKDWSDDPWNLLSEDQSGCEKLKFKYNCREVIDFCFLSFGTFVKGDPISYYSRESLETLCTNLKQFIINNPNNGYNNDDEDIYFSNEDIENIYNYFRKVYDLGCIVWVSY